MNIRELYKYSWFADLAYIRWDPNRIGENVSPSITISQAARNPEKIPGNTNDEFINTLGEKIFESASKGGEDWWVADFADNDIQSGFSASLFVNRKSGEKILAVTGTEDTDLIRDLVNADLQQIGGLGLALDQAVSLFNYVQELKGKAGENVLQLDVLRSAEKPVGVTEYVQVSDGYIWFTPRFDGVGKGKVGDDKGLVSDGDDIVITGHSLGGHLAAFGARLFPDLFAKAVTFNAPGFDADLGVQSSNAIENIIEPLEPLFDGGALQAALGLTGLSVADIAEVIPTKGQKITEDVYNKLFLPRLTSDPKTFQQLATDHVIQSFVAENQSPGGDIDGVTSGLTGIPASTQIPIVTEINSHSMSQIVDALGVQSLLERLNPSIGLTGMQALIQVASNKGEDSQEKIIDALSQLLLEGSTPPLNVVAPSGIASFVNPPAPFAYRAELHERLLKLENQLDVIDTSGKLRLRYLAPNGDGETTISVEEIVEGAESNIAYKYALLELNSFVVTGDDSIYDQHDIATTKLSEAYIEDRAKMLSIIVDRNLADISDNVFSLGEQRTYLDKESQRAFLVAQQPSGPVTSVVFGLNTDDKDAEAMVGGSGQDHLYAGDGDDLVVGAAGGDILDGGSGDDTLYGGDADNIGDNDTDTLFGGAGNDTYYASSEDIVVDSDPGGKLFVLHNSSPIDVAESYIKVADNVFRNERLDASIYIRPVDGNGAADARILISGVTAVSIEDFVVANQSSGRFGIELPDLINANVEHDDDDLFKVTIDAENLISAHDFSTIRVGEAQRDDFVDGTSDSDELYGISSPWSPFPVGADRDGGRDVIVGGAGNDQIASGNLLSLFLRRRDDGIYGAGTDQFGNDVLPGDQGDTLDGGSGDDIVYGADGDDVIYGRSDNDFLVGFHGRDNIFGGSGEDLIWGGHGEDVLDGGADDDVIMGDAHRMLVPVADPDELSPQEFSWRMTRVFQGDRMTTFSVSQTMVQFTAFNDELNDGDYISGGDGNDFLYGQGGADRLYGDEGDDVVIGGRGNDYLEGGTGDDYLAGDSEINGEVQGAGRDTLRGGAGDDTLWGEGSHDTLYGEEDNDTMFGGDGDDSLFGGAGEDQLSGDADEDYLDGGSDDDTIQGGGDDDYLTGGGGDDTLDGGDDDDLLFGNAGDDVLIGGGGEDLLAGGSGADILKGGADDDTYAYTNGDGIDVIEDSAGYNRLLLGGSIRPEDVTSITNGADLHLIFSATDQLIIRNWTDGGTIGRVDFVSTGQILLGANLLNPLQAGEEVDATTASATPIGTDGDDFVNVNLSSSGELSAGGGDDTYTLAGDLKYDVTITETSGNNILVLADESFDVEYSFVGDDYRIEGLTGENEDHFSVTVTPDAFASFVLSNGTRLTQGEFENFFTLNAPSAPVLLTELPDGAAFIGEAFSYELSKSSFFDANNETLTFSFDQESLPGWLQYTGTHFIGTPRAGDTDLVSITITAEDTTGRSVSDTFTIDVDRGLRGSEAAFFELSNINGISGTSFKDLPIAPTDAVSENGDRMPSVHALGDINGDGIDDFLAPTNNGDFAIYFGRSGGFGRSFESPTFNGYNGILLDTTGFFSFSNPPEVGDVNGDGLQDVVFDFGVGVGSNPVLLGQDGRFAASVKLSELPDLSELGPLVVESDVIAGQLPRFTSKIRSAKTVTKLGDVNGDGISDFGVVSAPIFRDSGISTLSPFGGIASFSRDQIAAVVFGSDGTQVPTVNLDALDGKHGFKLQLFDYIKDEPAGTRWSEITDIGDINNDGLSDIGIGSGSGRPGQPDSFTEQNIITGIIFGDVGGHAGSVDLLNIDDQDGFLAVTRDHEYSDFGPDALALGDINGDGIDDVLINDTESYVIYGRPNFSSVLKLDTPGSDAVTVSFKDGQNVVVGGGNDVVLGSLNSSSQNDRSRGSSLGTVQPGASRGLSVSRGKPQRTYTNSMTASLSGNSALLSENLVFPGRVTVFITNTGNKSQNNFRIPTALNPSAISAGLGSIKLDFGAAFPFIHLNDVDYDDVFGGPRTFDTFSFADGTVLTYEQLLSMGLDIDGFDIDEHLVGTSIVDRIRGFGGDDLLDGRSGDDTLIGGAGDDYYLVNSVGDVVIEVADEGLDTVESTVSLTLSEHLEVLLLSGTDAIDGTGNDADNTLEGNSAINTLVGGGGDDTFVVQTTGDVVSEAALGGTDSVYSSVSFTLGADIENLFLTGAAAIDGFGNSLDNTLSGNDNDNTLDGGAGADALSGGLGDDHYVVDNVGDTVSEVADQGIDTIASSISWTLGTHTENLALADGAIDGTGNAADNSLVGGLGTNTLTGGLGDDTYVVQDAADHIQENADEGTDSVHAAVSWSLGTNVEHLFLAAGNVNGTGNAASNSLAGGVGTNTLIGQGGDDHYVVQDATDVVVEQSGEGLDGVTSSIDWSLGNHVEDLTLTGTATSGTGNALNNTLSDSGQSAMTNTFTGGAGDDFYIVQDSADVIVENAAEGLDTVQSSASYTLGAELEDLVLTGTGDINGTGNNLANTLTGNEGDNTLDGAAGADSLIGGEGDDTFVVDHVSDVIHELDGEGVDTVESSINYTLTSDFVENLTLTGTATVGTGNAANNVFIDANSTPGTINTFVGGDGDDTYHVQDSADIVSELVNEGTDTVISSSDYSIAGSADIENLTLTGSAITATGNVGANRLVDAATSSATVNTLIGGGGDDTYVVQTAADVVTELVGEGTDEIQSDVTFTLSANVENLTLTGDGDIDGVGNSANNTLRGNDGENTLFGGDGDDTYYIAPSVFDKDKVVEAANEGTDHVITTSHFTLSDHIENLTLDIGSFGSRLRGNALINTVSGAAGNDTLDGAGGADTLVGGGGNDTYIVDNVGDIVLENADEGTADSVSSSADYTLSANVENLKLTGSAIYGGGNAQDNTLDDVAVGTANTFAGGAGDDIYFLRDAEDVAIENAAEGYDTIWASAGYTLGANFENLSIFGVGNFDGGGNAESNTLKGNSGINTLAGGAGNDYYVVQTVGDVVSEVLNEGIDTVESEISWTLGSNIENLVLTNYATTGIGNDLDNSLTGNSEENLLVGGLGNDVLDGGKDTGIGFENADRLIGGEGDDTYFTHHVADELVENADDGIDTVHSAVNFRLSEHFEHLVLMDGAEEAIGNAGDNSLTGNDANNYLDGGAGTDVLAGGDGDDYYIVNDATDSVIENAAEGIDTINSTIDWTLSANFENLVLAGGALIGVGNSADNVLVGNDATNTLTGGAGDDTYVVQSTLDVVNEIAAEGTDTIETSVDWTLAANFENLKLTGTTAISATGNIAVNVITGNSLANTLDGYSGADTLIGGAGDDTYVVNDAGVTLLESANGGEDTVISTVSFSLSENVENITLIGSGAVTLEGNDLDNVIESVGLANSLIGGAGDDTYILGSSGDVVTELADEGIDNVHTDSSRTLSANVENLTLTGTADADGTGNALDNILVGNSGSNTLSGGDGDDIYVVGEIGDAVVELSSEGQDLVESSISWTLGDHVEDLTLTIHGSIDGTGNTLNNTLAGNSASNTLTGGAGDDSYIVQNIDDVVVEQASGGTDTVFSSVTYTTGAEVENLTLTGIQATNATGNSLVNVLTGNSWSNTLDGGTGADTLIGGSGGDDYIVENAGDLVIENANDGIDSIYTNVSYTLSANVENLLFYGNSNLNGTGNELDNTLKGNRGINTLTGGDGDDTYIRHYVGDVLIENANEGIDSVATWTTYTLAANLENLTLIGGFAIDAHGNSENNTLVGNQANNTLDGLTGVDAMLGGRGDDTYYVDDSGDTITEQVDQGSDTVFSSVDYTLGDHIENITLIGSGTISAIGNALANTLSADFANQTLVGEAGDDTYVLQNGAATIVEEANAGHDTVIAQDVSVTLSDHVEDLHIAVTTGAVDATGNALDNRLEINASGAGTIGTLSGGDGDDTYIVDAAPASLIELAGEGIDTVEASVSLTLGQEFENLVLTDDAAIDGTGNALANTLTGNSAVNTLTGAAGDDVYIVQNSDDVVIENAAEGTDTVESSVSFTLGANTENLTLTGNASIDGTGNALGNSLVGNFGTNTLTGGAGDDIYVIQNATDVIVELSSEGTDTVESSVDYSLAANVENLTLTGFLAYRAQGNSDANTLTGNISRNLLDGGAGADALIGGLGDDTYVVDDAGDTVTEVLDEGTDSVQSSVSYTLTDHVENLTLTGTAAIDGTGNALNNLLIGNSGANTLAGGTGDDVYLYDDAADTLIESLDEGLDTVETALGFTLGANFEDLILTGTDAVDGTGNALDNGFIGNAAANTFSGGDGDDVYVVQNNDDVVIENAAEGVDTVGSTISWTLGAEIENLTLLGVDAIDGTGNVLDNVLAGNLAVNTLAGGPGDDTYVVHSTTDVVVENVSEGTDLIESAVSWSLGTDIENLTLSGTLDLDGTGNAGANTITGNAGSNRLDGGAGADSLAGGEGDDTYLVDNAADVLTEALDEGTDHVESSVTWSLGDNFETLTLTGTADINGSGNTADNVIIGNIGLNALDGGDGDDVYVVQNAGDGVTELSSAGIDRVESSVSWTLSNHVEQLTLTGTDAIDGFGNTLANTLAGNAGDNVLDGLGGADHLIGGEGDDTYRVDNTSDVVDENANAGTDTIESSVSWTLSDNVEHLTLLGAGAISGNGNALANTITGNTGGNALRGGAGDDIYIVQNSGDSVTEFASEGTDTVQSEVAWTLGTHTENLTLTGSSNIDGTGNDMANVLIGNDGVNTLAGGAGDDIYEVQTIGDSIIEVADEGTDRVLSSISWSLTAEVEHLALTGSAAVDASGNAKDNFISGNAGTNTLAGGDGDDVYVVQNATDVVTELANEGNDSVISSVSWTLSAEVENLELSGTDAIDGTGNSLDNVLVGNSAVNTLSGGAGDDVYRIQNNQYGVYGQPIEVDTIVENIAEGIDTVELSLPDTPLLPWSLSYTLAENVENFVNSTNIGGEDIGITVTANSLDNSLTGNGGDDNFWATLGANTLIGSAGHDTYHILQNTNNVLIEEENEGIDTVSVYNVDWTLGANFENLKLTSLGGSYSGYGNELHNEFTAAGTVGATFVGYEGDDVYRVLAGSTVVEAVGQGTDTVIASVSWTLSNFVENLILEAGAIGEGNDLSNTLSGNSSTNTLIGGLGNDTYVVRNSADVVSESANEGVDLVESSVSWTLGSNTENLLLTGTDSIDGTGNASANTLTGNEATNTLTGGAGDDHYIVQNTDDAIAELAGEGTDNVESSVTWTLSSDVENLTLAGESSISGYGNALNNTLHGNDAINTLDGGAGIDTLIGGGGTDIYFVDNSQDVIIEDDLVDGDLVFSSVDYTLNDFIDVLHLTGTADINADGNAFANTLLGNDGNNTLAGGAGHDVYQVQDSGDVVIEFADEGIDRVESSVDWTLSEHIENLTLFERYANIAIGNDLANRLVGNVAYNLLDGKAGADVMVGGRGNDLYYVDNVGDVVIEHAGEGNDTVHSSVTYSLSANVERLRLTGVMAIDGHGNDLDNSFWGTVASNVFYGGLGDDYYNLDQPEDLAIEIAGEGIDTVRIDESYTLSAHVENLELSGPWDRNGTGNALGNTLIGNTGNNTLTGLLGDDVYVVQNVGDVIIEESDEGFDTVETDLSWSLGANIEALVLTGTGDVGGSGNSLDNVFIDNYGVNTLSGGDGDDVYNIQTATVSTGPYSEASDVIVEALNEGTDTVNFSLHIDFQVAGTNTVVLADNVENYVNAVTTAIDGAIFVGQGNSLSNVLVGGGFVDWLDGGIGPDTLIGGGGDDVYFVDDIGDTIVEFFGEGIDAVQSTISWTLGASVENIELAGSENIDAYGNSLANVIDASVATGINTLVGAEGNDTYNVNSSADTIVENEGEGIDHVLSNVSWTLGDHVENLTLTGFQTTGTGNDLDNRLVGAATLSAHLPDTNVDTLIGGLGDDTYVIQDDLDTVIESANEGEDTVESSMSRTLSANVENLVLTGSDALDGTGNTLANQLHGNVATNTLTGGAGDDVYVVQNTTDVVVENSAEGTDRVESSVSWTLGTDVEHLTLTGTADVDGSGNSMDNTLVGNDGANILDGGAGADNLSGGDGNDTYHVENVADAITESLDAGIDTVLASISYTLAGDLENLTLTGTSAIDGTGNALDNTLSGNVATNTLTGGAGDDVYVVQNAHDVIVEVTDEGIDSVLSTASTYTLAANIENLTVSGTQRADAFGNADNNIIVGNSNDNVLGGAAGDDTLNGGDGSDTASFAGAASAITADLTVTAAQDTGDGTDLLISIENLIGSAYSDTLTGDNGNNLLEGGLGDDLLSGGSGLDTVSFANALGDVTVSLSLSSAQNTGDGTDTLVSIENAIGSGHNDTLTGNSSANTLMGGAGNDVIDGSSGTDTASYADAGSGVTVSLAVSGTQATGHGTDTLVNIEDLEGSNYDDTLTGDAGANRLQGGGGDDSLDGGAGTDELDYTDALGGITINLGGAATQNTGGAGTDTFGSFENLTGSRFDDTLQGDSGNNTISGLDGNDTLIGGAGDDHLDGLFGHDIASYIDAGAGVTVDLLITTAQDTGHGMDRLKNIQGLTGSAYNDTLTGNHSSNVIDGGMGDDYLDGGPAGFNVLTYLSATNGVTVDFADTSPQNTGAGTDTIQRFLGLVGSSHNDTLTGTSSSNYIDGGLGDDVIDGAGGNDFVVFWSSDVGVTADLAITSAQDTNVGMDTFADIESLVGSDYDDTLFGNDGVNFLVGGLGDDYLDGRGGIDTFYVVGDYLNDNLPNSGVRVDLSLQGQAQDTGFGWDTLVNIERAYGTHFDDTLIGDGGENFFYGANGDDVIDGGDGVDTAFFVKSTYVDLRLQGQSYDNGSGLDTLLNIENIQISNSASDTLIGDAGDNRFYSSGGDDTLDGGAGDDLLFGINGDDVYLFGHGYGTDRVQDSSGTNDIVRFNEGVSAEDLWFWQTNNELNIGIRDTTDTVVLVNWYSNPDYRIERLELHDGSEFLLEANVQQLVNAMSTFNPDAHGSNEIPVTEWSAAIPTVAAAWHGA